jgi:hypothetical protein
VFLSFDDINVSRYSVAMRKLINDMQCGGNSDTRPSVSGMHDIDLLDQRLFELDADKFDAFTAALDNPLPAGPALKALMKRRPLWRARPT